MICRVVSSPQRRAIQTAEPIAAPLNLAVDIDERFAEYDRDLPAYIPIEQIRDEYPEEWARMAEGHLPSAVDEDAFRVFRLNNGIYGQRQGGHNQMVRIKCPYGHVTAEQLEMLASISDRYSRGWGHLTTRQNVQFHFVQLERVGPSARPGQRGIDHPRGLRRHRPQRHGLSPGRSVPLRGARHQPLG